MILGHAAVAALTRRAPMGRAPWLFLVPAAFGPDWLDKPLKLFFDAPGHGLGHSLAAFAILFGLAGLALTRLGMSRRLLYLAAWLWLAHLLCDWVRAEALFWPLLGPVPNPHPESTAELAARFYFGPGWHPILVADLALTAAALAVYLSGPRRRLMARGEDRLSPTPAPCPAARSRP